MEEKYGSGEAKVETGRANGNGIMDKEGSESSTTSEEEDDEGILALGLLDEQVNATLEAIRSKDPRVYDEKVTFYSKSDDEEAEDQPAQMSRDKPMYLNDYHRENLLRGNLATDEDDVLPPTYAQQQDDLKSAIIKEMHAAVEQLSSEASSDPGVSNSADNDFLVRKQPAEDHISEMTQRAKIASVDVENADKDPEAFLSNFMSARAWVPASETKFQPFESDDDEEDQRAESFEEAYNLRFENSQPSNEKLISIARDTAAKYSVRKEAANGRKRARDTEQVKKEAQNQERAQEKARLRRLKIDEATEKVIRIKEAAGLRGESLNVEDWSSFLTEDWDDERWEAEMKSRFGDSYYAEKENDSSNTEDTSRRRMRTKPKWEDDIDITDIIPEFDAEEEGRTKFTLSEGSENESNDEGVGSKEIDAADFSAKQKSSKRDKEESKKQARKERQKIEELVDEKLNIELASDHVLRNKTRSGAFRYRETSPLAYGLTPHDILMASDSQLNQYAGLKKMATFREADKKKKDKKHLGKKARLRQWRKDTFGDEHGPRKSLQDLLAEQHSTDVTIDRKTAEATGGEGRSKKRKRSKRVMTWCPAR